MTIGIAACGTHAGRAVINALDTVEKIGLGAIGGFVSAVAVDGEEMQRAETQRGGTSQLKFEEARSTFECAPMAALISSGPDRPEPLSDFIVAQCGVGIVTGHRMPNYSGQDGVPLNIAVLDHMAKGVCPQLAIDSVLGSNPDADAGLIALNTEGKGYAANTSSVNTRPDIGHAFAQRNGACVLVLHNAIRPSGALAELVAEVAMDTLAPRTRICGNIKLRAGCPVRQGGQACLVATETGEVIEIVVAGSVVAGCGAINLGYQPAVVIKGKASGVLLYEPFLLACDEQLLSADGLDFMELPYGCQSVVRD
ncbi:MAG: hypothetical protein AB8B97_26230 [Granulosicoccus sp.]